jgi:hypothetical protein
MNCGSALALRAGRVPLEALNMSLRRAQRRAGADPRAARNHLNRRQA